MTVARFPSLAHWGAFTALVENGRVVGCEPFARDPAPSRHARRHAGDGAFAAAHRAAGDPRGLARRQAAHRRRPLSRGVVGRGARRRRRGDRARAREHGATAIFGGSYGWSSAGRVHHARTLLRRFLFLGGGCVDQVGNYSFGAAQYLLPRVIGTFQPVIGRDHRLVLDRQAHQADDRLRRAAPQERPGHLRRRRRAHHGAVAAPRQGGRHRVRRRSARSRPTRPDFLDAQWVPIRPNTDTALMLAMAHTLLAEAALRRRFLERYCTGFDDLPPLSARARRRHAQERRLGGRRSPAFRRETHPRSRAPRGRDAQPRSPAPGRCSAPITASSPTGRRSRSPRCSAASACPAAASASATARPTASACRAPTCPAPEVPLPLNPARTHDPGRAHRRHAARIPASSYEFNGRRYDLSRHPI